MGTVQVIFRPGESYPGACPACDGLPGGACPDCLGTGRRAVYDLARQRNEALALLRRWQEWFRGGTATPPRQTENSGDIARDTDALLARQPHATAAAVETYECGCQGTPGYRCPIHSCP